MSTAAVISPSPVQKFWTNDGTPLAGGLVYTYAAGTSTPIATYTDYSATTPNTNPIVLNFRGEASIWIDANTAYKYLVTDSLGNTISTTDQITTGALLTLYGGVDTGSANAYIINFQANFASLTNGIVIYFVAANNNTGASTIAVNGLGVAAIVSPSGGVLTSNQILAGQMSEIAYYNGQWLLLSSIPSGAQNLVYATPNGASGAASLRALVAADLPSNTNSGTFTGTLSGFTTTVTGTVNYSVTGNICTLYLVVGLQGTSNNSAMSLTGLPAVVTPVNQQFVACQVEDDSNLQVAGAAFVIANVVYFHCGVISGTYLSYNNTGFTNSGQKGITSGWSITYALS